MLVRDYWTRRGSGGECACCGHAVAYHFDGHGCTVENCGHDDHFADFYPCRICGWMEFTPLGRVQIMGRTA